jgi:ADP-heptose:LPS heptosyltransferase
VVRMVESRLRVPYKLLRNQYIRSIASIIQNADLLISNDTGIMHVGAAVETPVLSLFGPTDPEQWAPTGVRNRSLRGEGGDISMIPTQAVLDAAREMLRPSHQAGAGRRKPGQHHEGKKRK